MPYGQDPVVSSGGYGKDPAAKAPDAAKGSATDYNSPEAWVKRQKMMAMGKVIGVILGPSILLMGGLVVRGLAIRSARKRIVEKTESSPSPAPQFNGWQRLGLVSSILWIIISSGIFISVVIINDDYHIITEYIFIFFFLTYSPVVALWILGYAVAWIREGFRKSSS